MRLWWRGWVRAELFEAFCLNPAFGSLLSSGAALSPQRATHFSFASPKESKPRKGEPKSGPLRGSLRCSAGAEILETSPLRGRRTSKILIRPILRCSALPHGVWGSGADTGTDSDSDIFEVGAHISSSSACPAGATQRNCDAALKKIGYPRFIKCFRPLAAVERA